MLFKVSYYIIASFALNLFAVVASDIKIGFYLTGCGLDTFDLLPKEDSN